MKSLIEDQGLEVYIIFSDLFMLLFLCVSMMMGEATPDAYVSEQLGADNGQTKKVLSLYVDTAGALFTGDSPETRVEAAEVAPLLQHQQTQQIVLHTPATLPLGIYSRLQNKLLQFGASEISYIPDGGYAND